MSRNIIRFPQSNLPSSKINSSESSVCLATHTGHDQTVEQERVIFVDFAATRVQQNAEQELQQLRDAFDEARASWVLEEAELPELNKLFFHS